MDAKLVMFRESGERREFALKSVGTLIGRDPECDIRIPLPEVSRRQAELLMRGQALTLVDLESANGTFVNNQRAPGPPGRTLRAGDHLIVGPVVFTVQIDGQPASIRPVKTRVRRRVGIAPAAETVPPVRFAGLPELDDDDPISAIEALAGDTAQTVVEPYLDDD